MARNLEYSLKILPALLLVIAWQMLVWAEPQYEFFVGAPVGIFHEAVGLARSGVLGRDIGVTALEAFLGFLVGSTTGTASGLAFWYSNRVHQIAQPYVFALGSVPVFALGPILIFWFGTGLLSKVVLGFLSTFAIAVVQSYNGASEADPNLQKLLKVFGASRAQVFTKVIVPSSTIWVLAGVRINIGMALLGAFIGEFIASKMGLGNLIVVAEGLYNVNQIWVGVCAIIMIATVSNLVTSPIERWARKWQ